MICKLWKLEAKVKKGVTNVRPDLVIKEQVRDYVRNNHPELENMPGMRGMRKPGGNISGRSRNPNARHLDTINQTIDHLANQRMDGYQEDF